MVLNDKILSCLVGYFFFSIHNVCLRALSSKSERFKQTYIYRCLPLHTHNIRGRLVFLKDVMSISPTRSHRMCGTNYKNTHRVTVVSSDNRSSVRNIVLSYWPHQLRQRADKPCVLLQAHWHSALSIIGGISHQKNSTKTTFSQ